MKEKATKFIDNFKTNLLQSSAMQKAGAIAEEMQANAGWVMNQTSKLPLAKHVLAPLLVMSRYKKDGKIDVPQEGLSAETIDAMLDVYHGLDMKGPKGKVFAYYYDAGERAKKVCYDAYFKYLNDNALDPTVTPSVMALENELIEMAKRHVNAPEEVVGNVTTGGTESIILAVKTARDWARAKKPHIKEPEMILPVTAHAAFHKAAAYLNVKTVSTPVVEEDYRADVEAMRQAITDNTILLVGSAPSYAHGVVDPIRDIAKLAKDNGLLCHVDACVGGFLLHHFKKLDKNTPDYDFSIDGVTSMSLDLHKYGFAAKPASIVLQRDKALREFQIFAFSGWTGYTIVNPTILSTRSGGPIAGAWAVMNYLGQKGYLALAKAMYEGKLQLVEGIARIPDLYVMGKPDMNLVAVTSDTVNVFHIADEMKKLGWYIQPQLGLGTYKQNFHFSIAAQNVPFIGDLLKDLEKATRAAKRKPKSDLANQVQNKYGALRPSEMTDEIFEEMLAMAGITGVTLPETMAEINEILNALTPDLADALLKRFYNDLNRYQAQ